MWWNCLRTAKGNLWFGTIFKGVARYTPSALLRPGEKTLTYFSEKDGLPGTTVASIAEDKAGNMWFGTHSGLSKYDPSAHFDSAQHKSLRPGGKTFTNFTQKDGLCHDRVSNILVDRAGNIWVGTWGGVCRYKDGGFSDFPIPKPDVDLLPYQTTMDWITEIMEDKQGNIWFGRDGYGACKYDGASFTHFTKKDGLPSNNVQVIEEDEQGNIWFGTRVAENDHPDPEKRTGEGGLCRYDPSAHFDSAQRKSLQTTKRLFNFLNGRDLAKTTFTPFTQIKRDTFGSAPPVSAYTDTILRLTSTPLSTSRSGQVGNHSRFTKGQTAWT